MTLPDYFDLQRAWLEFGPPLHRLMAAVHKFKFTKPPPRASIAAAEKGDGPTPPTEIEMTDAQVAELLSCFSAAGGLVN